jgi:hypothetical protein
MFVQKLNKSFICTQKFSVAHKTLREKFSLFYETVRKNLSMKIERYLCFNLKRQQESFGYKKKYDGQKEN